MTVTELIADRHPIGFLLEGVFSSPSFGRGPHNGTFVPSNHFLLIGERPVRDFLPPTTPLFCFLFLYIRILRRSTLSGFLFSSVMDTHSLDVSVYLRALATEREHTCLTGGFTIPFIPLLRGTVLTV